MSYYKEWRHFYIDGGYEFLSILSLVGGTTPEKFDEYASFVSTISGCGRVIGDFARYQPIRSLSPGCNGFGSANGIDFVDDIRSCGYNNQLNGNGGNGFILLGEGRHIKQIDTETSIDAINDHFLANTGVNFDVRGLSVKAISQAVLEEPLAKMQMVRSLTLETAIP